MSNDHIQPANHHDGLVQKTAHEIEHRYQHGENVHSVMHDEIHQLRASEIKNGHGSSKEFKHDLKQLEAKLQADHILPHLHIDTSGKHIGSVHFNGSSDEHGKGRPNKAHDGASPDHSAHPHRPLHPGKPAHPDAAPDNGTSPPADPYHTYDRFPKAKPYPGDTVPGKEGGNDRPDAAAANGEALPQLKQAIDRAKAEGRPLNMVQIGDSHIEGGIETPALAKGLSDRFGVKVDYAMEGIRGAKATDAVNNPAHFLKDINKNTDLVVVSFGSNDSTSKAGPAYKDSYEKLIKEIKEKAPNASIVMVGPTDGAYSGKPQTELAGLDSVTAEQRQAAATVQNGSYFDIRSQMGSIAAMRAKGYMANDNLHFTPSGYQAIGDEVAQFISSKVRGS